MPTLSQTEPELIPTDARPATLAPQNNDTGAQLARLSHGALVSSDVTLFDQAGRRAPAPQQRMELPLATMDMELDAPPDLLAVTDRPNSPGEILVPQILSSPRSHT